MTRQSTKSVVQEDNDYTTISNRSEEDYSQITMLEYEEERSQVSLLECDEEKNDGGNSNLRTAALDIEYLNSSSDDNL